MILIPRLILAGLLFLLGSLIGLLITLLRPFNPTNCRILGQIFAYSVLPVLRIDHRCENLKGLDEHRPCIFVSNHQDSLDIFSFGKIVPKRTVSLGKKSIKFIPIFGQFYWLAGNIMIDRKNKMKARGTIGEVPRAINEKKTSIWVMPEGTRTRGRGVMKFKKGAFYAAISAQCPIVPVACSSNDKNVDLSKLHGGHIWLKVLPPIETKGMAMRDAEALSQKCHQLIVNEVKNLDNKIAAFRKSSSLKEDILT